MPKLLNDMTKAELLEVVKQKDELINTLQNHIDSITSEQDAYMRTAEEHLATTDRKAAVCEGALRIAIQQMQTAINSAQIMLSKGE